MAPKPNIHSYNFLIDVKSLSDDGKTKAQLVEELEPLVEKQNALKKKIDHINWAIERLNPVISKKNRYFTDSHINFLRLEAKYEEVNRKEIPVEVRIRIETIEKSLLPKTYTVYTYGKKGRFVSFLCSIDLYYPLASWRTDGKPFVFDIEDEKKEALAEIASNTRIALVVGATVSTTAVYLSLTSRDHLNPITITLGLGCIILNLVWILSYSHRRRKRILSFPL